MLTAWLPTFDVNAIELPNGHRKNCIGHFDQDVTVIINETERMIESVILFATEKFFLTFLLFLYNFSINKCFNDKILFKKWFGCDRMGLVIKQKH